MIDEVGPRSKQAESLETLARMISRRETGAEAAPRPHVLPRPSVQESSDQSCSASALQTKPAQPARQAPPPAAAGAPPIATRPQKFEPQPAQPAPPAARAGAQADARTRAAARRPRAPTAEIVREQSEYYHQTKTTIFNALLNTIDLAQLAQLDQATAAEEIRDIVAELVAIKNVSMSVAETDHLVQDVINDVLGYGPLEPLLARDEIADIMCNGANRVFIEVGGKVQLTNVRFRDNAQLMNICQRIVSQVGRRVDEVLADLRRAPAGRQPGQRHRLAACRSTARPSPSGNSAKTS